MRKLFIRVAALTLFSIFIYSPAYCSAESLDYQDDKTGSPASLAACIPGALAEYLLEMDIDITLFQPVSQQNPSGILSLLEAEYQGNNICLVKTPAGKGIFLMDKISSLPGSRGLLITFDVQQGIFQADVLSPDCILQISSTLQSVFYTIFDCAIAGSIRGCVIDVMGLFTNLYLLPIVCQEGYTLTVIAENGTVAKSTNAATFFDGDEVTLTAYPNIGYSFSNWSGDASGSANPFTITMDSDKEITANFTEDEYRLRIVAINGTVTKEPDKATYTYGEEVLITAVPNAGYSFVYWGSDAFGSDNPTVITVDSDKNITANFE
jgi:hypothetical protein